VKFENGVDFGCVAGLENDSEPKASSIPPNDCVLDCKAAPEEVEGCIPSKALAAGCAAGAAGFEAYRDKIDCFRSDRPVPAVPGPVLDGLAGAEGAPPKKSKPNRLSPGLDCRGAGCCGGALGGPGLPVDGSVVFGLAG
jgi:hypothetical protein